MLPSQSRDSAKTQLKLQTTKNRRIKPSISPITDFSIIAQITELPNLYMLCPPGKQTQTVRVESDRASRWATDT